MSLAVAPPYDGSCAFEALAAERPEITVWRSSVRLAVNLQYVSMNHTLQEGDEICFVPPVSGG
jgi:molybdopterin converting factor small subunit